MAMLLRQGNVTVVELDERYDSLDVESIDQLSRMLLDAAGEKGSALLLDLSETRFIGSRFIGLLVRVWKRIRDRNGRMGLCCVAPFCRDALISTRLYDTLWDAYETREQALADLS